MGPLGRPGGPFCVRGADLDPVRYAVSLNLARRQMTVTERAFAAEKVANMPFGGNQHHKEGGSIELPSQPPVLIGIKDAAKMLGVSEPSVKRARAVETHMVVQPGTDRNARRPPPPRSRRPHAAMTGAGSVQSAKVHAVRVSSANAAPS